MSAIERPLRLGELFAETVRLYGERVWASLGLGLFVAASILLALLTGTVAAYVAVTALSFTAAFAVAARLVSGDAFTEAWAQVALRSPVLLVLALVVMVPFVLGKIDIVLLIAAVAWLAFTGLSIPAAMLEHEPRTERWHGRLAYALWRSVNLARVEYLHALGVAAALVLVYAVLEWVLAGALVGFAENSGFMATVLAQVVLAPFFFLGLSVLYFEQRARALSSRGPTT